MFRVSNQETFLLEAQLKLIQERLVSSEENMAKLCSALNKYVLNTSKLRDANDTLALTIHKNFTKEIVNKSIKNSMLKLADQLALLGDSRDNCTQYLQQEVVQPLVQFRSHCKMAKSQLKYILGAREKELCKRKELSRLRHDSPHNRVTIFDKVKGETELSKICCEVSQMQRAIEESAESLEKKKLRDLKGISEKFVRGELVYHIEAVEILTKACAELNIIDTEKDLKEFKAILKQSPMAIRLKTIQENLIFPSVTVPQMGETTVQSNTNTNPFPIDSGRTSAIDSFLEYSYEESSSSQSETESYTNTDAPNS